MRHQRDGKKFGRTSAHRSALRANQVTSLIQHGRVRTTAVKAKVLRRTIESAIGWAASVAHLTGEAAGTQNSANQAKVVHALRVISRIVRDEDALKKLFFELGPRFSTRRGGYSRITRLSPRPGDASKMALIELLTE